MRGIRIGAAVAALFLTACGADSAPNENQAGAGGTGGTSGEGGTGGGGTGGIGGIGGIGGTGGSGGSAATREETCEAIAAAWVACGGDAGPIEACIEDESMSDERMEGCAACSEAATCEQLFNLACATACGPPLASLTLRGAGFEGSEGSSVNIEVVDEAGASILGYGYAVFIQADGAFLLETGPSFPEGGRAFVHIWADLDDDASCGSELDHQAIVEIEELHGETEILFTQDLPDAPSVCSGFEWVSGHVDVEVTGLDAVPDGATGVVLLLQVFEDQEFSSGTQVATVTGGSLSARFRGLVARDGTYAIRWFVDVDANGACDITDVGGVTPFVAQGGTSLVQSTPAVEAPSCALFYGWGHSLSFAGTGFEAVNGQSVQAYVLDAGTGAIVASNWAEVAAGAFSLEFVDAVPGGMDVEMVYSIDVDLDGVCAAPPDVVGRIAVGALSADANVSVAMESGDATGVCTQLNGLWGGI